MDTKIQNAVATGNAAAFFHLIKSPVKFRIFLLNKLPSAFFSGVRVKHVDENTCQVRVPYKWFSRNPFKSTYFACLSMAAEMSTGVLAMGHLYKCKPAVSMLVVKIEGEFLKKAVDNTVFICDEGRRIKETIAETISTGEGVVITVKSVGKDTSGDTVAVFNITWSFKRRKI